MVAESQGSGLQLLVGESDVLLHGLARVSAVSVAAPRAPGREASNPKKTDPSTENPTLLLQVEQGCVGGESLKGKHHNFGLLCHTPNTETPNVRPPEAQMVAMLLDYPWSRG